jgi:hypothetical protein
MLEWIVRLDRRGNWRAPRLAAHYALSAIYAVEYYNGVANELGSSEAFMQLVGQRPTSGG